MLDVCLLGTGGCIPKSDRWLASALFRYRGKSILIDCGEGTQIALKRAKFTFKPIDVILITHFHADHISGLPGFLLSMGNEGRCEKVTIAGPAGLSHVVKSLLVIAPGLPFELEIHEFPEEGGVLRMDDVQITSFKAKHSCSCLGYRIDIPRAGKFDPERAKANNVPLKLWSKLQKGESATLDGVEYAPDMVLGPERKGLRVCYVTDSRPTRAIREAAEGADLLICEGMFGDEKRDRALKAMHMTMAEAASIAKEANCAALWLTHFSPSVNSPSEFINEAEDVFPETRAGYDSMTETLFFE